MEETILAMKYRYFANSERRGDVDVSTNRLIESSTLTKGGTPK